MVETTEGVRIERGELLVLLAKSAHAAYFNSISGHQSRKQSEYTERYGNPVPGDLVLEITNVRAAIEDRIGRLVSCNDEPPLTMSEDEYDEQEWGRPWPPYKEKVWRIITVDGNVQAWQNAEFIVIPEVTRY